MNPSNRRRSLVPVLLSMLVACSEDVGHPQGSSGSASGVAGDAGAAGVSGVAGAAGANGHGGDGGMGGTTPITGGNELVVEVSADKPTYVKLDPPSTVTDTPDIATGTGWDLSFQGYDVHTNSGPSGPGMASGFGPLESLTFLQDTIPNVPFTTPDTTGGAFVDWYKYEGAPAHVLWSRYHTMAVQDGSRSWKVQVLGYYGELQGAPIAAVYSIRYAEITENQPGPTVTLDDLDGTAGGLEASETEPSECLDLGTGARSKLTPSEAHSSSAWHLCFRRQNIGVNGELGGPRGVGAVDLEAAQTEGETLEEVKARTASSEQSAFDTVTRQATSGLEFRGDRIISVFDGTWLDRSTNPPSPTFATWLVVGADGQNHFLVVFEKFEDSTGTSPGSIHMRIKSVH